MPTHPPIAELPRDESRLGFGLRAQIALALIGVLALSATLAAMAIGPLTQAGARQLRLRAGATLSRAIAGQAAHAQPGDDLHGLLEDAVGPGALSAAAVFDADGHRLAGAGRFVRGVPRPPFGDAVAAHGDVLTVHVAFPQGGAFASEVSLAPQRYERALPGAVLLYASIAAFASLFVVYVLLTRYTVRPVEALTRAAERVASGRRDTLPEPRGAREVVRAARAFNDMTRQLAAREADLSGRVHELETLTAELRRAQEQLVRTERLAVVGRLAAGIAHEVGNPLAAIVGLTDVMKDGGLDDAEVKDFSERIGREAQRIHRTVRDLLDYARAAPADDAIGSDSSGGATARGDVAEAVSQVMRLLEPQKTMKGIELVREIESALPSVRLTSDRLVQVLLNLTLNAAQAIGSDDGPPRASAETPGPRSIRIRARTMPGKLVRIDVEDDGPGITPEVAARVFEPFFTTKPAGEGTGLGMAICSVIVEAAGGAIRVVPRESGARGACIQFDLPMA